MASKVIIGIQARSTSKRFPNKVHEMIGNRTVLQHVVYACEQADRYVNKWGSHQIEVSTCILIPEGDPIGLRKYGQNTDQFEGPEDDVLTRYYRMNEKHQGDYVVRITADCPLIPPYLISKSLNLAVTNGYDYISNVDERVRTSGDGFDCEVFSKRMLTYAYDCAVTASDREHVTPFMRRDPPIWAHLGTIVNHLDLADLKLSIDTLEDLERVRDQYNRVELAVEKAHSVFGRRHVHRF